MPDKDKNGLATEVFEAAFCTVTRETYVYEMYEEIMKKLKYAGTYQDGSLRIFQGHRSIKQTFFWLCNFQAQVDEV
eukprot:9540064-Ditylum_brightwellii.AAC.1